MAWNDLTLPKESITNHIPIHLSGHNLPIGAYPSWYRLPYDAKIPFGNFPRDKVIPTYCKLGQSRHRTHLSRDFELTDPMNKDHPSLEYNCLTDPNLQHYFVNPKRYERLVHHGLITRDGMVKCSPYDYNAYRRYLYTLWVLEVNRVVQEQSYEERIRMESLLAEHKPNKPIVCPDEFSAEVRKWERRVIQIQKQKDDDKGITPEIELNKDPGILPISIADERWHDYQKKLKKAYPDNYNDVKEWLNKGTRNFRNATYLLIDQKKQRHKKLQEQFERRKEHDTQFLAETKRVRDHEAEVRKKRQELRERDYQNLWEKDRVKLDTHMARRRSNIRTQCEKVSERMTKFRAGQERRLRLVDLDSKFPIKRTIESTEEFLSGIYQQGTIKEEDEKKEDDKDEEKKRCRQQLSKYPQLTKWDSERTKSIIENILPTLDERLRASVDLDKELVECVDYVQDSMTSVLNSILTSENVRNEYVETTLSEIRSKLQDIGCDCTSRKNIDGDALINVLTVCQDILQSAIKSVKEDSLNSEVDTKALQDILAEVGQKIEGKRDEIAEKQKRKADLKREKEERKKLAQEEKEMKKEEERRRKREEEKRKKEEELARKREEKKRKKEEEEERIKREEEEKRIKKEEKERKKREEEERKREEKQRKKEEEQRKKEEEQRKKEEEQRRKEEEKRKKEEEQQRKKDEVKRKKEEEEQRKKEENERKLREEEEKRQEEERQREEEQRKRLLEETEKSANTTDEEWGNLEEFEETDILKEAIAPPTDTSDPEASSSKETDQSDQDDGPSGAQSNSDFNHLEYTVNYCKCIYFIPSDIGNFFDRRRTNFFCSKPTKKTVFYGKNQRFIKDRKTDEKKQVDNNVAKLYDLKSKTIEADHRDDTEKLACGIQILSRNEIIWKLVRNFSKKCKAKIPLTNPVNIMLKRELLTNYPSENSSSVNTFGGISKSRLIRNEWDKFELFYEEQKTKQRLKSLNPTLLNVDEEKKVLSTRKFSDLGVDQVYIPSNIPSKVREDFKTKIKQGWFFKLYPDYFATIHPEKKPFSYTEASRTSELSSPDFIVKDIGSKCFDEFKEDMANIRTAILSKENGNTFEERLEKICKPSLKLQKATEMNFQHISGTDGKPREFNFQHNIKLSSKPSSSVRKDTSISTAFRSNGKTLKYRAGLQVSIDAKDDTVQKQNYSDTNKNEDPFLTRLRRYFACSKETQNKLRIQESINVSSSDDSIPDLNINFTLERGVTQDQTDDTQDEIDVAEGETEDWEDEIKDHFHSPETVESYTMKELHPSSLIHSIEITDEKTEAIETSVDTTDKQLLYKQQPSEDHASGKKLLKYEAEKLKREQSTSEISDNEITSQVSTGIQGGKTPSSSGIPVQRKDALLERRITELYETIPMCFEEKILPHDESNLKPQPDRELEDETPHDDWDRKSRILWADLPERVMADTNNYDFIHSSVDYGHAKCDQRASIDQYPHTCFHNVSIPRKSIVTSFIPNESEDEMFEESAAGDDITEFQQATLKVMNLESLPKLQKLDTHEGLLIRKLKTVAEGKAEMRTMSDVVQHLLKQHPPTRTKYRWKTAITSVMRSIEHLATPRYFEMDAAEDVPVCTITDITDGKAMVVTEIVKQEELNESSYEKHWLTNHIKASTSNEERQGRRATDSSSATNADLNSQNWIYTTREIVSDIPNYSSLSYKEPSERIRRASLIHSESFQKILKAKRSEVGRS